MSASGLFRWLRSSLRPEDYAANMVFAAPPASSAHLYPDVPAPDDPTSLNMLAVKWTCGDLYAQDMPSIAADLLEIGYDSPSLRRLAGEIGLSTWADAEPLVSRVLAELGIDYPITQHRANAILIRQIAREVIAGKRNPWAAASHIEIAICGWTAELEGLDALFAINDEINWDLAHRRGTSALTKELLDVLASLAIMPLEGEAAR